MSYRVLEILRRLLGKKLLLALLIWPAGILVLVISCGWVFVNVVHRIYCSPSFFNPEAEGMSPNSGIESDLRVAQARYTPHWTPDGTRIVFVGTPGGAESLISEGGIRPEIQIYVVASDGSHLVPMHNDNEEYNISHSPSISPDGSRIAYSKYRYVKGDTRYRTFIRYFEIESSSLDGSDRRRLTEGEGIDTLPAWSPDGARIAFVRKAASECAPHSSAIGIYTMNADGSKVRRIVRLPLPNSDRRISSSHIWKEVAWSPDAQDLAFIITEKLFEKAEEEGHFSRYTTRASLIVHDADGSDWTRLVNADSPVLKPNSFIGSPVWSPDGKRIAFMKYDDDLPKLYTIEADGSGLREVVSRGINPFSSGVSLISWSPNGSQIRFTFGPSVYLVNADGSGLRRTEGEPNGSWSPDGSKVANAVRGGSVVLYTTATDGSDIRVLVRRGHNGVPEAVSPEQRRSADIASCSDGVVVPNPDTNLGLVRDCEALVDTMDGLVVVGLNWNMDTPIDEWEGVTLDVGTRVEEESDSEDGLLPLRVVGLSLPMRGLRGSIPSELERLTSLSVLNLSENHLSGPIPSGLGNLSALEYLNLSENRLLGSMIPPELGNLSALKELKITHVGLRGPIPSELGSLSALEELDLSYNRLSGSIPPELGNLSALAQLALSRNGLTGPIPPELGNLSTLLKMDLSRNGLGGSIPPELGNLSALKELNLRSNDLSGPIPPELGNLSALEQLNLSFNDLSGIFPPELVNLSALEHLDLNNNPRMSGCIPLALQGKVRGYRPIPRYCEQ